MMMPTPTLLAGGEVNPFVLVPADQQSNTLDVFYLTDRVGKGQGDKRSYGNGVDEQAKFGTATVQFGSESTSWNELVTASLSQGRARDIKLSVLRVSERGTLAGDGDAIAADINRALDQVVRREISIYVQGVRDDFDGSVTVAAQLRHYPGHRQVVIAYAWPCRQRLMQYSGDVNRARASAPHLAELIEFLAANTKAEHINVLGYSAGATLVVEGLAELRKRHAESNAEALRKELRVGNVMLAAADLDLQTFVREQLEALADVAEHVSLTVSSKDKALSWASTLQGGSRLGRPDVKELTPQDLEAVSKHKNLHVIDVSTVKGPHSDKSGTAGHGYWYTNPWVSSDVLTTLIWQLPPEQRGLVRVPDKWRWTFPPDYPQRVRAVVSEEMRRLGSERREMTRRE
jgi:esterase/lipase superfamily enzyme